MRTPSLENSLFILARTIKFVRHVKVINMPGYTCNSLFAASDSSSVFVHSLHCVVELHRNFKSHSTKLG